MQTNTTARKPCPRCGSSIDARHADGLCPRCLMDSALNHDRQDENPFWPLEEPTAGSVPETGPESSTGQSRPFGNYELVEVIARGGMGVVYKARQRGLNRWVALKMILAGPLASMTFVQRFRTEAQLIGRLRHPHIVAVHELGEQDGQPYFAMDYIEGEDLARRLREGSISLEQGIEWVHQLALAVQYAHEQGVLHRDLKPSNILIDAAGQAHITDFGLAKELANESELTAADAVLGTPSYMAPEQADPRAKEIGPTSDVYALGAILYELLTHHPPFRGETPVATLRLVQEREPIAPNLLNPAVNRDLNTVCLKALEKVPRRRYLSARALAEDLSRVQAGVPIAARPVSRVEKMWRWSRQHPWPVLMAVAASLLLVILVLGSLAAAWRIGLAQRQTEDQRRQAEAYAAVARQRLADSYVVNGTRLLESGDPTSALPWLTAALALDQTNPERAAMHRLRLGATLRHCPTLRSVLVHASYVNHGEFSPDGTRLVTAGNDRVAYLWSVESGQTIGRPMEHDGDIAYAVFSPDGQRIATVSEDHTARLWNGFTGEPLSPPMCHENRVNHGVFSLEGDRFLTASADGTARVWDAHNGQPILPPLLHPAQVWRAFFSVDGRRIITSCDDHAARVWDSATGVLALPPLHHNARVTTALFSPDGTQIVSASTDGTARLWSADTGEAMGPILRHTGPVNHVAFSPRGDRVATASTDQRARLWDVLSGELIGVPMVHSDIVIRVAFSPDGQWVLTTSQDQSIRLWDAQSGRPASPPMRHNGWVRQAAFSPDGRLVISVSGDRTAKVWAPATQEPVRPVIQQEGAIHWIAFDESGARILTAGGSNPGQASVWNARTGEKVVGPVLHPAPILSAAKAPGSKRVVTGDESGLIKVWDAFSGQACWESRTGTQAVRIVAFSADGRLVTAATGRDIQPGWARVFDAESGAPASPLATADECIYSAALSPNGKHLLLAISPLGLTGEGRVEIREVVSGNVVCGPLPHRRQVHQAIWSPDGDRFLTTGADQAARLWNARTGELLPLPMNHAGWILGASFSATGQKIATFSFDQTARVWDAATGTPLTAALAHRGVVRSAVFSADGRFLATSADDQACRVWDTTTGQLLSLQTGGMLRMIAFSPDNQTVAIASGNGRVCLFSLEPEARSLSELTRLAELLSGRRLDAAGGMVPLEGETLRSLTGLSP